MNKRPTPRVPQAGEQQLDPVDAETLWRVEEIVHEADGRKTAGDDTAALRLYQEGLEALRPTAARSETVATLCYEAALCCARLGDAAGEEEMLYATLEANARHRAARLRLARLFAAQGEHICAQVELQAAAQLGPLDADEAAFKAQVDSDAARAAMGVLKGWGNKFLGLFGLSTDDFQVSKNADGSVSIQSRRAQ